MDGRPLAMVVCGDDLGQQSPVEVGPANSCGHLAWIASRSPLQSLARSCSGTTRPPWTGPADGVAYNLRALLLRLEMQLPQARIDIHWPGRQQAMLGQEAFLELIRHHLDDDSLAALLQLLNANDPVALTAGRGGRAPYRAGRERMRQSRRRRERCPASPSGG